MSQTSTQTPHLKAFDAGLTFSGQVSGTKVLGYDVPSENTPIINPNYEFYGDAARDIACWFVSNEWEPLYFFGATGSGKTSLVKQLAAKLNYPVFEYNGNERTELQDLIGHHTVKNGTMYFEYGSLTQAMKQGGIFLFNEIDLVSPAVLAGLNTVLDGSSLVISENGGEVITPHKMFRFVATANTQGNGDESGIYSGTLKLNGAFLDRFLLITSEYLPKDVELRLLGKTYPTLPTVVTERLVDFANEVRKLYIGELQANTDNPLADTSCEVTLSTRTILRFAGLILRYEPLASQGISPVMYALDRALAYRASATTRAMLHELAQRIFGITDAKNTQSTPIDQMEVAI